MFAPFDTDSSSPHINAVAGRGDACEYCSGRVLYSIAVRQPPQSGASSFIPEQDVATRAGQLRANVTFVPLGCQRSAAWQPFPLSPASPRAPTASPRWTPTHRPRRDRISPFSPVIASSPHKIRLNLRPIVSVTVRPRCAKRQRQRAGCVGGRVRHADWVREMRQEYR